ncbi:MAG: hypothetical protein HQ475_04075 [SAR202 cluster bacterium]|nr:hypothetical protein [SAR202 cluster bacterium]
MSKFLMLMVSFAVIIGVVGVINQYRLGDVGSSVFAQEHDDDGGGHCCDAPPPDEGPPPDDGSHDEPPPGDDFSKEAFDSGQTFEYLPDGSGLALFEGIVIDPSKDFDALRAAGLLGENDPAVTGQGNPTDAVAGYFEGGKFSPDVGGFFKEGDGGEFHFDFESGDVPPEGGFNPGAFSKDFFSETFKPGEFQGDFGEFFNSGAFGKGELDTLFSPGDFKPEDFGSLFKAEEFNPGDFGKFAAVGEDFVDFGDHFEEFFGERGDEAKAATAFFAGFNPGDFREFDKEALLGQVHDLDYQGFKELDKDTVFGLFNEGLAGEKFDLKGEQWAGAFSKFDVQEIKGFDQGFIEDAVHDFSKEDFLGIPDDQAFALFESTFFGKSGIGPGGPPVDFNPEDFAGKLDDFGDQLGGFMGAFGQEHYEHMGTDLVFAMMGKVDFTAPDFDKSVFSGEDVGHAFAAMDFDDIQGLGDKVFEAIGRFESGDISKWDPEAAFNVFNSGDFDQVKGLGQIGGLVGAMGNEFMAQVDDDKLLALFEGFNFGSQEFETREAGLDGKDIAGLMGNMDRDHLNALGGQGIIDAMQRVGKLEDLGVMGGDAAFDVFAVVGLADLKDLDQFEGLVANFRAEQIQEFGDQFGDILKNVDFKTNGAVLGEFSFDALDGLFGAGLFGAGDLETPDVLADLANSVGGDQIFHLHPDKLQELVVNVNPNDFTKFSPTALSGMFAGMDQDQIAGFDFEKMRAVIEAAEANFLGGFGRFDGIAGGDTAFDLLANAQGFDNALEGFSGGAVDFFGRNLFGN